MRPQRRNWTLPAVGSGLALALVAAIMLPRQDGAPENPAPVATVPVATAPVAAAIAPAAQAEAATAAPITASLSLRIGSGAAEDRVASLLAALDAAGFDEIAVKRVAFRIGATRIGYFHDADLAAAEAARSALAPGEAELRNLGAILPVPPPGSLDIWIEG